jgi:hypothetical protein
MKFTQTEHKEEDCIGSAQVAPWQEPSDLFLSISDTIS